jgi:hypothetical protein
VKHRRAASLAQLVSPLECNPCTSLILQLEKDTAKPNGGSRIPRVCSASICLDRTDEIAALLQDAADSEWGRAVTGRIGLTKELKCLNRTIAVSEQQAEIHYCICASGYDRAPISDFSAVDVTDITQQVSETHGRRCVTAEFAAVERCFG